MTAMVTRYRVQRTQVPIAHFRFPFFCAVHVINKDIGQGI